jgi:hypothetical protein
MNPAHYSATIENTDEFHQARLLILLSALAGKTLKPVNGIMKLAKLDFLLRYPRCLRILLEDQKRSNAKAKLEDWESDTIESRMIRFRYGPWDERYRRWLSLLSAKGLVTVNLEGRSVVIQLTEAGKKVADTLAEMPDFETLLDRSKLINSAVGSWGATKLKDYVYRLFPELLDMKWGEKIEL